MQPEKKVLAAVMNSRGAYDIVAEHMDERDFTAPGWVILTQIGDYYDHDASAERSDPDVILARIGRRLANPKALENFKEIVASLPYDLGSSNVTQELLAHKREGAAARLQQELAGTDTKAIATALADYQKLHEAADLGAARSVGTYIMDTADLFTKELSDAKRIKIAPKALNDLIGGGAFPGHCIILFGRVEMGKSLFALNASAGFVNQGYTVLYIENEDPARDTLRRFTQRLIMRSLEWCKDNPAEAKQRAAAKGIDRFIITEEADTLQDIEAAIIEHAPDCVVINQMRNMVDGENAVGKLDTLAHKLRRIGKKHQKLMLLVTAAKEGDVDNAGNIRDKRVLQRADVYSSKTGIPGAADLLLGWGGTEEMKRFGQGTLSVSKNKLVDAGGHGVIDLTVDPRTGKIDGERK